MQEAKIFKQLIIPRYLGFLVRVILTYGMHNWFDLANDSPLLLPLFSFELIYLFLSHQQLSKIYHYRHGFFILLTIDNSFWITWLALTGGVTNAFISSLLIPIAIASVALPLSNSALLTIVNCLAYSLMLYLSQHSNHMSHHMDMSAHYIGMWLNFIASAAVIHFSLIIIIRKLKQRDQQISTLRESQLKQEQLVAIGASSAQMAHQLATPLCSMRLWLDELNDKVQREELIEIGNNLTRCEASLNDLRQATEAIREGKQQDQQVNHLLAEIKQKATLLLPNHQITWHIPSLPECYVNIDHGVIPAIITLIDNAGKASSEADQNARVEILITLVNTKVNIQIRDFGHGIKKSLQSQLGKRLVNSPEGLGMALLLTHATLERNHASLTLSEHSSQGCIARVQIPTEAL